MQRKIIGERITSLLESRGVTQKDLATVVGVHQNVISYWCRSVRMPGAEQIVVMAKYFNVSSDYLLGLSDEETVDQDIQSVCSMTGLSAKSVNAIIQLMKSDPSIPGDDSISRAVNMVLSTPHVLNALASSISGVMECCELGRDYLKEERPPLSRFAIDYQTGKIIDNMELSFFKSDEAFRNAIDKAFNYRKLIDELREI